MIRADLAAAPRAYGRAADDALDTKPGLARARSSSTTPRLTRSERAILRVLEYRMNGKGFAFPSQKLLAKDAEYSPRAVKGAIAGLQRKRKLVVKRVSDLTEDERALVEAASPRVVRNWRNNVYFRFEAQGIVRGREGPRSGAIAARDTILIGWKGSRSKTSPPHQFRPGRGPPPDAVGGGGRSDRREGMPADRRRLAHEAPMRVRRTAGDGRATSAVQRGDDGPRRARGDRGRDVRGGSADTGCEDDALRPRVRPPRRVASVCGSCRRCTSSAEATSGRGARTSAGRCRARGQPAVTAGECSGGKGPACCPRTVARRGHAIAGVRASHDLRSCEPAGRSGWSEALRPMKKSTPAPAGMLLRHQVAWILGVTPSGVQRMQERGKLRSVRDLEGRDLFARVDVFELARLRRLASHRCVDAAVAAQVFEMFRAGWDLPEIVIETGESPRTIRALHEDYPNRFHSRRDARRGRRSSARG
jgi:hypothetical protein